MFERKYANKFPPCPLYDVEVMESWLEDLAKQGLILTKTGLFLGFAEFERTTPKAMRYRLQPLPNKKLFEDAGPAEAAVELAKEYGWEHICNMGEFSVYACDDPDARELDTDPQVQALTLKQYSRRKWNTIIIDICSLLILLGMVIRFGPISFVLDSNFWFLGSMLLVWLGFFCTAFAELKRIREMKRKLTMNEPLSRNKNWRKNRWYHAVSSVLLIILCVTFFVAAFINNFIDWEDRRWQPISEYQAEIPFALMEDLAGGGTLVPTKNSAIKGNHIAERSSLLAARQLSVSQIGDVVSGDTILLNGYLDIQYCEFRTQWPARQLFKEMTQQYRINKRYHLLPLKELPTEQEIAYSNVAPILLLQNGNRFMKVQFLQYTGGGTYELDQWAAAIAEVFLSK